MTSSRHQQYDELADDLWEETNGDVIMVPEHEGIANGGRLGRFWAYISNAYRYVVALLRKRTRSERTAHTHSEKDDGEESQLDTMSHDLAFSQSLLAAAVRRDGTENTRSLTSRGVNIARLNTPDPHASKESQSLHEGYCDERKHDDLDISNASAHQSIPSDKPALPESSRKSSRSNTNKSRHPQKSPLSKSTQIKKVKPRTKHRAHVPERIQQTKQADAAYSESQQMRNRFGWQNRPHTNVGNQGHVNRHQPLVAHTTSDAELKPNLKQPKPLKSKAPRVLLDDLNEPLDSGLSNPRTIPTRDQRVLRPKSPAVLPKAGTTFARKSETPVVPKGTLVTPQVSAPTIKPIGGPTRPAPLLRKNRRSTLSLSPRRNSTHTGAAREKHEHKHAPADIGKNLSSSSNIKSPRIRLMSTFNAYSPQTQQRRFRYHCANVLCGNRETDWDVFPLCAKCDTRYCTQLCAHIDRYRHKEDCRSRSFGAGVCGRGYRLEPEVPMPPSDKYNLSSRTKKIISQRLSNIYAQNI